MKNSTAGTNDFVFLDQHLDQYTDYTFAIILTRFKDHWVFVRHRERSTWELPAGHVESGESVYAAAERELWEETGAINYSIDPIVSYQGRYKGNLVYGMLCIAQVEEFGPMPNKEIAEKKFFTAIPEKLTYPEIQPLMISYYLNR